MGGWRTAKLLDEHGPDIKVRTFCGRSREPELGQHERCVCRPVFGPSRICGTPFHASEPFHQDCLNELRAFSYGRSETLNMAEAAIAVLAFALAASAIVYVAYQVDSPTERIIDGEFDVLAPSELYR
jgi:hypothetical protein